MSHVGHRSQRWLSLFFAASACSWVPHWSCHYYRLETGSSFAVGAWDLSPLDSAVALFAYGLLIGLNAGAVAAPRLRLAAAGASGILHVGLGGLHAYRLVAPFRFEVLGYPWSQQASLREALVVTTFGALCLWVAGRLRTVSQE